MDYEFIRPCLMALQRVCRRVLDLEIRLNRPIVRRTSIDLSHAVDKCAVITFREAHEGLMVLAIPEAILDRLADRLNPRDSEGNADHEPILEFMVWVRSSMRKELKRLNVLTDAPKLYTIAGLRAAIGHTGPVVTFPVHSPSGNFSITFTPIPDAFSLSVNGLVRQTGPHPAVKSGSPPPAQTA